MTYLDHLNAASEALQDALDAAPHPTDREQLQTALDQVNDLLSTQEAIERRADQEDRAR